MGNEFLANNLFVYYVREIQTMSIYFMNEF